MRNLTTTLCLTIAVLLGMTGVCFALPPCPSDQNQYRHNCFDTYTYASGSKYVGEWKNNKRHGQGTYTFAKSGNKYVGEWKNGKRHGQGTYNYADGSKYVGEYKNGKRHGQGTYTYATGDKHVGEWKNGKRHGQGTYTYASGKIFEGIWKDNKFQDEAARKAAEEEKQKKRQTKKKEEKLQKLKRFGRKYQNREKSLVEEVLNYTLTNQLKGDLSAFWVSNKQNPCVLQIYGTQVGDLKELGVIKKNKINFRKINQTGFVINREHKQINWAYKAASYFVLKSGPIIYFQVPTSHVDGMRLRKAWRLAFKECPGKRSRF